MGRFTPRRLAAFTGMLLHTSMTQAAGSSKAGMSYAGDSHETDYEVILSSDSPISWYYTWSPYQAPPEIFPDGAQSRIEFVPALHGIDTLDDDIKQLDGLPDSSKHLFTFNEPDGTTGSGGSSISPEDAAKAYIDQVVPLRDRFQISHPSVTGSGRGLQWLKDFSSACWDIDEDNGCPTDFVTAHWYGNFEGLASWLGQLGNFYKSSDSGLDGDLKIWVSEFALVQQDESETFAMMNQTLPYLDNLDSVEKYAWFGVFRPKDANDWTGDSVSLLQNDGGLSELGAYYLGGEENGFKKGDQGIGSGGNGNDGNDDNDTDDTGSSGEDDDDDANEAAGLRAERMAGMVMILTTLLILLG